MKIKKKCRFTRCLLASASLVLVFLSPSCINVGHYSSVQNFNCTRGNAGIQHIPGTPGIIMAPTFCQDYTFTTDKLSKAIHIFVEEYSDTFEIPASDIWGYLSRLKIEVSIQEKKVPFAFDVHGSPVKNVYVNGLALSRKHIWVEIKTRQINTSSLISLISFFSFFFLYKFSI